MSSSVLDFLFGIAQNVAAECGFRGLDRFLNDLSLRRNFHLETCVVEALRIGAKAQAKHSSGETRTAYEAFERFAKGLKPQHDKQIQDWVGPMIRQDVDLLCEVLAETLDRHLTPEAKANTHIADQIRRDLPGAMLYSFQRLLKCPRNEMAWIAFQRECWKLMFDNPPHEPGELNQMRLTADSLDLISDEVKKAVEEVFEPLERQLGQIAGTVANVNQAVTWPPRTHPAEQRAPDDFRQYFSFRFAQTSYQSDAMAISRMMDFRRAQESFLWMLVTGEAGAGKSRFALEEVRSMLDFGQYDAFFFDASKEYDQWDRWQPEMDTLIVFDYAYRERARVKRAIQVMAERSKNNSLGGKKVRFLMLEREVAGRFLESELRGLAGGFTGRARRLIRWRRWRKEPWGRTA